MVRPSGRRGDDDLGPVTERTGRVQGRTVTASSRGLRGRHSTSDLLSTPTPFAANFHYDTGASGPGTQSCKPYIQQFPMLGHKFEHKLLDIRLRLDMMTVDEARRPASNRMYVVRNLFVEALWLEAPSHLLTETWTSVPTIPPIDPPMPETTLLDLIVREVRRDDLGKEEKYNTIGDLLTRHYRST
ncbi:hypothetical protein M9H77_04021 [Catharanthus roseus]|uniref:Uncharacterized protein n=1 Tax=Catharanthus roseus TaxID=4058 RepID=A0ACC0CCV0_CATRO|nr:hypothetical protein M9H77_04021 [Catharanthus roseus]